MCRVKVLKKVFLAEVIIGEPKSKKEKSNSCNFVLGAIHTCQGYLQM